LLALPWKNDAMLCFILEIKNYNLNETPGWNGIAWFMLSGNSGPHTWRFNNGMWWFSPEVHLLFAT
jgi:hypothetical protein